MTLVLSNAVVANNAAQGAVIGAFNVPVRLQSQTTPDAYFLVSGVNLLVEWAGEAIVGDYSIQVHAPGGPPEVFIIHVVPVPTAVSFYPPDGVPHDLDGGWTVVASDGSGTVKVLPPVLEMPGPHATTSL